MSKKIKAFTLIELLVVISIIALLVSILLPSLNTARELAKRVVCSTQLKSIFTQAILYAEDYEDILPIAKGLSIPNKPDSERQWPYYIWISMDSAALNSPHYDWVKEKIFMCPSSVGLEAYSYAMNKNFSGSIRTDQITHPDRVVYIADSPDAGFQTGWSLLLYPPPTYTHTDIDFNRHTGETANILYANGSISPGDFDEDWSESSYWSLD